MKSRKTELQGSEERPLSRDWFRRNWLGVAVVAVPTFFGVWLAGEGFLTSFHYLRLLWEDQRSYGTIVSATNLSHQYHSTRRGLDGLSRKKTTRIDTTELLLRVSVDGKEPVLIPYKVGGNVGSKIEGKRIPVYIDSYDLTSSVPEFRMKNWWEPAILGSCLSLLPFLFTYAFGAAVFGWDRVLGTWLKRLRDLDKADSPSEPGNETEESTEPQKRDDWTVRG